ncbi:YneF family protein [Mycoplasma parvum]|uniref:YneF family protein n=1 Tax=Mycoplasma parvum str. Indiana TaxID=1403316 RepID=U5NFQ9_9MOLU|nr:YneF family protein [Mycoplasma parvum]AGX89004.1 hypothetical protein PRV_01210 [Mycoplasma parvum str. Indiana]
MFFQQSCGQAENIAWACAACVTLIIGFYFGYKLAVKRYKRDPKENWIKASQIRELYRQLGRTPTEKQIKQLLTAVNKTSD